MHHILDNPLWNSLNSGCKQFALGNDPHVKYFQRDAALFAGMDDYNETNFRKLSEYSDVGDAYILFTAGDISIPVDWEVKLNKTMLQMVFQNVLPEITNDQQIKVLDESHVTQMLDLTKRTNRGPFFNKTILLGNYLGIFDNKKLIAMAGQRNKIGNYTEVSAVCTDPGFTGKGYAKKIMVQLMHIIMKDNYIPMLHLFKDNTNALALYFKLGFEIRRELQVYFIQKK